MNRIQDYIRRTGMTILFLMALFATFQSISGVKANTLAVAANSKMEELKKLAGIPFTKKIHLQENSAKSLQHTASAAFEDPPSLEEAVDWAKYPKETVVATGYTAGFESTGKNKNNPEYGITFSGVKVKRDLYSTIAADLNIFPIGTVLFIPGYGYGVVADKGGAIKGKRLDLYYETVHDVYQLWGKRKLEVYVIEKGNGRLTESKLKNLNENKSMQVFRQQYTKSERR